MTEASTRHALVCSHLEADALLPATTEDLGVLGGPIVAGDLDGDGMGDLVVAATEPWDDAYGGSHVVPGAIVGTLDPLQNLSLTSRDRDSESIYARHAALGDIDLDGKADSAVAWPYDRDDGSLFLVGLG